jgi:hypothetical protein
MSEYVYRAQRCEETGWWVTYGPRRPVAEREWIEGPMRQEQAVERAKELAKGNENV